MKKTRLKVVILIISTILSSIDMFAEEADNREENYAVADSTAILLDEINISAGIVNVNKSPLRIKTVEKDEISLRSTGRTFPELVGMTPGVFATSESGSYGDAKINIRGFKQENISVLLNGIPISGLTSGSMFWNNWMGLSDATSKIEVSKGIGSSMLSDNSVGGTINIITQNPDKNKSFSLGYNYTGYGTSKTFFNYNSGELKNGWGVSLMGSYVWGKGYVECTDVNSGAYLLSVSKKFRNRHSLLFTALGSPEQHKQRSSRMTYAEMEQYGRDYNKNWGYYKGQAKTISQNTYYKPYFTLSHFWDTTTGKNNDIRLSMNNSIYLAIGNGGGYWTESKGQPIISYQKDGHIDWDSVVADNQNGTDRVGYTGNEAQNIMSDYMAGHTQAGLKSSVFVNFNDKIELETGLHYQLYNTWEKEVITDLLGGDFWYEDYASNSLAGQAGRNSKKVVGDYIRTNNGRNMHYLTLYAMSSYYLADNHLILKLGASGSGSLLRRWDKYNYIDNIYSDLAKGLGGSVKAGALYKINNQNSLYLNAAAYSRTPYANIIFLNGDNEINKNVKNETNYLGELGYRLVGDNYGLEATFYSALWKDKSVTKSPYKQDIETERYAVTGLDAFHYGGELDVFYNPTRWTKLSAYASIGEWKWINDATVTIYDYVSGLPKETKPVYSKGLHVGDAPQTQVGAIVEVNPFAAFRDKGGIFNISDFTVRLDWQYNDRYWADFDPTSRTNPEDRAESYRIPAYHLMNLGFRWDYKINNNLGITLFCNINNLLDTYYVERSKDGADHSKESFTGYWGMGRNYNFGIRLNLL